MKEKQMGNPNLENSVSCFLCGSDNTILLDYLRLNSTDLKRNLAYLIPKKIANILGAVSSRFAFAYNPVATNKKFFNRQVVYCRNCLTGSCRPHFLKDELAQYYQKFYWNNRDNIDGQHVALGYSPNERQLGLTADRIAWIEQLLPRVESVIDFGAGDCAAAFLFSKRRGVSKVHVVDPSIRAGVLAAKYHVGYSDNLDQAPVVDLVYSAHSIEHVPNFLESIGELLTRVRDGGHIFFETPNIGDHEIFSSLCHTPHTFMLSASSFRSLQATFPLKIIKIECCGPAWSKNRKHINSIEKADLRVLMQKIITPM